MAPPSSTDSEIMSTLLSEGFDEFEEEDAVEAVLTLDDVTVEVRHAGVMSREAADSNGCEAVANSIKQGHSGSPIGQCTGNRQPKIDIPEGFCCFF